LTVNAPPISVFSTLSIICSMQTSSDEPKITSKPAIAAMLAHLQRSGVAFLPRAETESVGRLSSMLGTSGGPLSSPEPAAPPDRIVERVRAATRSVSPNPTPNPPSPSRLSPAPAAHAVSAPAAKPYETAKLPTLQRTSMLDEIANEAAACRACASLCNRTQTVPGEGSSVARVCFLGEAPGADEDASGRPFVGRAGQLLTKMIEACTFSRDDVFILNTIKCRPPGNRNPEHQEVENCRGFLERQLEIIQPEYIVCLGLVAAQTILHTKLSVGRLRGQFHAYRQSKVLVTYHPSYLLREPEVKKAAWADLQFLLRDMAIELPKK